ncbi:MULTISPECIES: GNAT family N-acetyltransferase [Aerococcus]|nr:MULTISPECIES: GNAT family N-acetyltransferase [Aerococcus]MDK6369682.1 GNAT family N-acetyltransferase [Aerococcus sp. UMB9870]MDK6680320.1 GNAT family N-acetyltransferase [Aerococcus sp. UMB8608]MDK6686900.1 GNAT family N-acetyltransferase [Aerococcus sp. UMB8623]MDK6940011.1 GNAT family N-acetyltransferase [Aerococcus sp. UMB8487]
MELLTYQPKDLEQMTAIWNDVLEDGLAFPGTALYSPEDFADYLAHKAGVTCMKIDGELAGFYTLSPNNIGRCGHVANASYCMNKAFRGRGLFASLVEASLEEAKSLGFKGMQFNAVVAINYAAIKVYTQQGFQIVGTIPDGFLLKNGTYSNIYIMYRPL